MLQVEKKLRRMINPGANNKKLKGNKKKVVVDMKDMFRNVMWIMMAQLEQSPKVNIKEGIRRYGKKAINAVLSEYG